MGFVLSGTKEIMSFWDNVRTKTNWFGLSGIKIIVGLVMKGTESKIFLWYDVRAEIKPWWHGCICREVSSQWERMQGQWLQRKYGTTLWEDSDLAEKLEGV